MRRPLDELGGKQRQRRYTWSLPSPEQREDFVGAEAGAHGDRYSPSPSTGLLPIVCVAPTGSAD
jgi:hypothetical protein